MLSDLLKKRCRISNEPGGTFQMHGVTGVFVNPMGDQVGESSFKLLILIGRQKRVTGAYRIQNQRRYVQIAEDVF